MSEWQPISTASKRKNILCWDGESIAICTWEGHSQPQYSKWHVVHDAEDHAWHDYSPTHWTSLPEPPK